MSSYEEKFLNYEKKDQIGESELTTKWGVPSDVLGTKIDKEKKILLIHKILAVFIGVFEIRIRDENAKAGETRSREVSYPPVNSILKEISTISSSDWNVHEYGCRLKFVRNGFSDKSGKQIPNIFFQVELGEKNKNLKEEQSKANHFINEVDKLLFEFNKKYDIKLLSWDQVKQDREERNRKKMIS